MNTASEDIKDLLEAESSLGLTFSVNLFIGREPAMPNNTVTLFDSSGGGSMLTYTTNERYYYPDLQIRVRNVSYLTGMALAQDISDFLHCRKEIINNTVYTLIRAIDSPFPLDWDENNRARIVVNFSLQRRPEGD